MLRFDFSTCDLEEEDGQYYHDTKLSFPNSADDTIGDIVDKFKFFLLSLGYSPATIEERLYPTGEEGD